MITNTSTILSFANPIFFIKLVFMLFLFMCIVFLSVLLTQINSMENIISQEHSSYALKILAVIQIAAEIGIFIYVAFML